LKTLIRWFMVLAALVAALGSFQALAEEDTQAKAFAEGRTVQLPPYIVLEQAGSHWRYVSAPNLEVISKCEDWETAEFVEAFITQDRKLAEILPDFLRMNRSIPMTIILITPEMARDMRKQMAEAMRDKLVAQQVGLSRLSMFEIIPQMVLWDNESVSMMFEFDGGDYSTMSFMPDHIQQLLDKRVPKLPTWFKQGMSTIYRELHWKDGMIGFPTSSWPISKTSDRRGRLTIPEAVLPMQEFLDGPWSGKDQDSSRHYELWCLQADLFLRWALDDKSHARREALWKFVDRSSRELATEALFKQCLGLGFSDMEKELANFIPKARMLKIEAFDADSVKSPNLSVIRDATAGEVGWIKGSFDLKEIAYVEKNRLPYADKYIGQAEADLTGPYRKGVRDPEFLAVLGLYYSEVGKNDLALPILEQAVAAHIAWPHVYIELARIRKADVSAKPSVSHLASDP